MKLLHSLLDLIKTKPVTESTGARLIEEGDALATAAILKYENAEEKLKEEKTGIENNLQQERENTKTFLEESQKRIQNFIKQEESYQERIKSDLKETENAATKTIAEKNNGIQKATEIHEKLKSLLSPPTKTEEK